jgi:hypothetical protein
VSKPFRLSVVNKPFILNDNMLNNFMLGVVNETFMLRVIMLNAFIQRVVMLSFVAPILDYAKNAWSGQTR